METNEILELYYYSKMDKLRLEHYGVKFPNPVELEEENDDPLKICEYCGDVFSPPIANQNKRFCSYQCRNYFIKNERNEKN